MFEACNPRVERGGSRRGLTVHRQKRQDTDDPRHPNGVCSLLCQLWVHADLLAGASGAPVWVCRDREDASGIFEMQVGPGVGVFLLVFSYVMGAPLSLKEMCPFERHFLFLLLAW